MTATSLLVRTARRVARARRWRGRVAALTRRALPGRAVPGAIGLPMMAFIPVIIMLGMIAWAEIGFHNDDAFVAAAVDNAAIAAARTLPVGAMAGDAPAFAGCAAGQICDGDATPAGARARAELRAALLRRFRPAATGAPARVDVDAAIAGLHTTIYDATPSDPITLTVPATGKVTVLHYPTLRVFVAITIGLLEADGVRFTRSYTAWPQEAT